MDYRGEATDSESRQTATDWERRRIWRVGKLGEAAVSVSQIGGGLATWRHDGFEEETDLKTRRTRRGGGRRRTRRFGGFGG